MLQMIPTISISRDKTPCHNIKQRLFVHVGLEKYIQGMLQPTANSNLIWAHDQYTSSTLIGGKGGAGPSSLHKLCLRDQQSMWMQDGCKVYVDSYMASNGSCFMVTWTIFKNHLLEVGLTQNWETMALQMLTTVGLFYFIMCEEPLE